MGCFAGFRPEKIVGLAVLGVQGLGCCFAFSVDELGFGV